jgi:hypothetical protein
MNQKNPRWRVFSAAYPGGNRAEYTAWIRRNSDAFRKSRCIRADFVPPDMQDEFTDWLRLQHMEIPDHA